jgi:hypothetical protein
VVAAGDGRGGRRAAEGPAVVGLVAGGRAKAYPRAQLTPSALRGKGKPAMSYAVMDRVGGVPIALLVGGDGISVRAFDRRLEDGRTLELMTTFGSSPARFVDTATGSEWDLSGTAVAGPLAGRQLTRIASTHRVLVRLAAPPSGHAHPHGVAAAVGDRRGGEVMAELTAMIRRHAAVALLLAAVTTTTITAQTKAPKAELVASVSTGRVHAGKPATLLLKVVLPAGIHVQSNKPRNPAFFPTALTLTPPAGLSVKTTTYPAAVDFRQEGQDEPLAVFEKTFTIAVAIELGAAVKPGELTIPGRFDYQACDDKVCYRPVKSPVEWTVSVAP